MNPTHPKRVFVAFDPGHKLGAVAWITESRMSATKPYLVSDVQTKLMVDLREDEEFGSISEFLRSFDAPIHGVAVEGIPMIDAPGSCKLFKNYGAILEAVANVPCNVTTPTPQEWKRCYTFPAGMTYAQHKAYATDLRKRLFPQITPIHRHADDAVLILKSQLDKLGSCQSQT